MSSLLHGIDHNGGSGQQHSSSPPLVQVVAPCTIQAGYTFMVTHDDRTFRVVVPQGGVTKGQTFTAPLSTSFTEISPFLVNNAVAKTDSGSWRDGLCDCCRHGHCHAAVCNAIICPQILMAQVLSRLKLDWCGNPTDSLQAKKTFLTVFVLVCLFWILSAFLSPSSPIYRREHNGEVVWGSSKEQHMSTPDEHDDAYSGADSVSSFRLILYNVLTISMGLYTLIVLTKLRRTVRTLFEIPIRYKWMGNNEDCCLAFWCGCCTIAQVARQTCEYDKQAAACCSPTGLMMTDSASFVV